MTISFLMGATGLVVFTLLLLLRPWQSGLKQTGPDAALLNTTLYREQLAELDRELALGSLSVADFELARNELERRLLDDLSTSAAVAAQQVPSGLRRKTAWVLVLLLPLLAAGIYRVIGTPAALTFQAQAPASAPSAAQGQEPQSGAEPMTLMTAALAARLAQSPNNPKGWAMLGRSYHSMGRVADAVKAFERVGPSIEQDPASLADYADVLASQAGGQLKGRPQALIEQALRVDPDHPMALELAAMAAAQRGDIAKAMDHWAHLLKLLPADSVGARWVATQMADLRTKGGAVQGPQVRIEPGR